MLSMSKPELFPFPSPQHMLFLGSPSWWMELLPTSNSVQRNLAVILNTLTFLTSSMQAFNRFPQMCFAIPLVLPLVSTFLDPVDALLSLYDFDLFTDSDIAGGPFLMKKSFSPLISLTPLFFSTSLSNPFKYDWFCLSVCCCFVFLSRTLSIIYFLLVSSSTPKV